MILCLLAEGEHSVGELNAQIEISQSALSQHLAVLKNESLVQTRRDGLMIYYTIADDAVGALMACLHEIYCE